MAATINLGANSGFQAGIIHGPVNTVHHYAAPERPETPPDPTVIIPFSRDEDFIPRGNSIDRIHEASAALGSRVALVGLGGVGKSQVAIEYAYQVRDRSPETWVFWVHASNAARYEQSFRDIAEWVKIPERRDPQANIYQLVGGWLRSGKRKWTLILDNVDVAEFLLEDRRANTDQVDGIEYINSLPLFGYLPTCANGTILITTRSKHVAHKLVEQRNVITLNPMEESEALALVEKKLGSHIDSTSAGALVVALECMPLAIVQATAYISQRAPRCSVRQYLEMFEKSDRKKATLLDYDGGQLRRDREAKKSILITWQISFEHIRQSRPSAADLLALMSYFDRQGIPQYLLRTDSDSNHTKTVNSYKNSINLKDNEDSDCNSTNTGLSDADAFEDDLAVLRNYSFVSVTGSRDVLEMHRLVQIAMQNWLAIEGQEEKWKQRFISHLYAHLPNGEYENWECWQTLLPHAKAAIKHKLEDELALMDWASVLYLTGWYFERMGIGHEAERVSVLAMKARIEFLGRDNEDSLNSIAMVASVYRMRGRWEEAEKLELEVMETRKQKLGADHPDTLTSMANLASTFWNQGRWEEAEKLEVEVMETSKQKLGADHPDTLTSMANLASTYRNQGRWEEAEKLEVEVMETSKQKLGADHPDTLTSMNNLSFTLHEQGRYTEALKLMRSCVERRQTILGLSHPHYISSAEVLDGWMSSPTLPGTGKRRSLHNKIVSSLRKTMRNVSRRKLD